MTACFDIIGDVHGCIAELKALLKKLGYSVRGGAVSHRENRKLIFLGDLVSRGPDAVGVLRLVMGAVESGAALCVQGNQDMELVKKLKGENMHTTAAMAASIKQLEKETKGFVRKVVEFFESLPRHLVLDRGRLVAVHGGIKRNMVGRKSPAVTRFALEGEATGKRDEFGTPIGLTWPEGFRGKTTVVYGHKPTPEPRWIHNTVNIDTGCVYGGKLTALRYPEKETISVKARRVYSPVKRQPSYSSK